MSRKIELVFAGFFVLFFIGWIIFDLPVAFGIDVRSASFYAREIDPIYLDPPSWLRTIGWFAFGYGPFYLVTAWGFLRRARWLPYVLLPLAGMVVTSTGIYLVEDTTGDVPPSNAGMFWLLNAPYVVVPIAAAIWVIARRRKSEDGVESAYVPRPLVV